MTNVLFPGRIAIDIKYKKKIAFNYRPTQKIY